MAKEIARVQKQEELVKAIATYAATGNLSAAARDAGVSWQTVDKWKKAGFLDPEDHENAVALATKLGPERMRLIAEKSYQGADEAIDQTRAKLPDASAREASRVAVELFSIGQLASGQATSRVEHYTRDSLITELQDIFDEDVIEGEVVEEAA
jgi:hypothetical protein